MEFTSSLPPLSSEQNPPRWQPPDNLRIGQHRLWLLLHTVHKTHYAIRLPTGYGKSWCACIAFAVWREQMKCNRALFVVPSRQQLDQYINGLPSDLAALGIPCRGLDWCENTRAIRLHQLNKAEIFITTIQSIAADPSYYADLMGSGRWGVIADEFHHYADGNSWGEVLKALRYDVMLGMSATPFRADGTHTVLSTDIDITITVEEATKEGAIRGIRASIADYFVDIAKGDQGEIVRMTLSELAAEAEGQDFSEWEAKKKVRYNSKYLSQMLTDAVARLEQKNMAHPKQHQMLVFAMSCKHAAHLTDVLNTLMQDKAFAAWIGEGPNGKDPKENERLLRAFLANDFPCLIQVNKAGEGFNNKRCSVGVFLNLLGDTPMARQQIGRFMRRNGAIVDRRQDFADVFASSDARIVSLLQEYQEQTQQDDEEQWLIDDDQDGDDTWGVRLYRIPDLVVLNMEFKDLQVVWPFGSKEATLAFLREQNDPDIPADMPDEKVLQAVKRLLFQQQYPTAFMSEKDRLIQARDQVKSGTSLIAKNALKLRFGPSFEQSMLGDLIKRIHWQWNRVSRLSHDEMTSDEFQQKLNWLKSVDEEMHKTRRVPAWLNI